MDEQQWSFWLEASWSGSTLISNEGTPQNLKNFFSECFFLYEMSLDGRRPVYRGLRTTKAQTSLPIPKVSYLTCYKQNFNFLASLCSWAYWFESHFVWNPEDRFSRDGAQIVQIIAVVIIIFILMLTTQLANCLFDLILYVPSTIVQL